MVKVNNLSAPFDNFFINKTFFSLYIPYSITGVHASPVETDIW